MKKARAWQWLNILGIDAAIIAVVWQLFFLSLDQLVISIASQLVLGLSVWLTYMADRLYDIRSCNVQNLLSLRHQFAHKHRTKIWRIWWSVFIVNIALAFFKLTNDQLSNGFILLFACLAYTWFNQLLSKRFFPKELFVALIFSGGVIIFVEPTPALQLVIAFVILCLINCIAIAHKELKVDKALCIHSLSAVIKPHMVYLLSIVGIVIPIWNYEVVGLPITLTLSATLFLYWQRDRISVEQYRVIQDTALITGPSLWLIIN